MARRKDSADTRKRILSACVKLFMEQGYKNTKMTDIMKEAKVSNSSFQNLFKTKDGVLMDLVEFMFGNQFSFAAEIVGEDTKPSVVYAVETAIQLTLTELNENLREIYKEAYSHHETEEYIFQHSHMECYELFHDNIKGSSEADFYEYDIGVGGIMRNYMARPCDQYFTLERKITRYLEMTMKIYNVPDDERDNAIDFVLKSDIRAISKSVMQRLFDALEMRFDFEFEN